MAATKFKKKDAGYYRIICLHKLRTRKVRRFLIPTLRESTRNKCCKTGSLNFTQFYWIVTKKINQTTSYANFI